MASASQISFRNLGRQSWVSAPTPRGGTRDGTPGRRALRVVAESRRDCTGQRRTAERLRRGCEGMGGDRSRDHPKGTINAGQSLSQPAADSSLCTREPLGTGDADCRVASLLAMTVLILCHSEEAQRADVGIRPFCDGRGSRPPYLGHGLRRPNFVPKFGASVKSSAPTGAQHTG